MSIWKKNRVKVAICVLSVLLLSGFSFTGTATAGITWKKIIDNGDPYPAYSEVGAWNHRSGLPFAYGNDYAYLSVEVYPPGRKGTATWRTEIPYDGIYRVKVSYRATVRRTPDADYFVDDGEGGQKHFVVNQVGYEGQDLTWSDLGLFQYKKGDTVKVVLDGTDDSYTDCADAVSWELVKLTPPKVLARLVILNMLLKDDK